MRRVLVTGITGMVGLTFSKILLSRGYQVVGYGRTSPSTVLDQVEYLQGDLSTGLSTGNTLDKALAGVDTVFHLAGRAHQLVDTAEDPLSEFRRVNTEGTRKILDAALVARVRRIVYVSTVNVYGESESRIIPLRETDTIHPDSPYGRSKYEAELLLQAATDQIEVVIVRPTLVYGPYVKANFYRLIQLVDSGVPLPFGRANNRRSIVSVYNLSDFLIECMEKSEATGEAFLISDGAPVSTIQLIREIGQFLGRRPQLIPVPRRLMQSGLRLLGKKGVYSRLWGSLEVDITKAQNLLNWNSPLTRVEALERTIQWYHEDKYKIPPDSRS